MVPGGDQLEQDNSGATSKTKKKMAQGGSHREQKSGENGGTASKAKSGDEKERHKERQHSSTSQVYICFKDNSYIIIFTWTAAGEESIYSNSY